MGSLRYDNENYRFDDRVLAHVQIVIAQKLRRHEGFLMSWRISIEEGSGRTSIWLNSAIPITFTFEGSRAVTLNREWLQILMLSADSPGGLVVTPEAETPRQRPVPEWPAIGEPVPAQQLASH